MAFVTVAKTGELAPGAMKVVMLGRREVVVANVGGTFVAFDNECTHSAGPLGEGELVGEVVICRWHESGFNVRTGAHVSGPATDAIRVYALRVEGDAILIADA